MAAWGIKCRTCGNYTVLESFESLRDKVVSIYTSPLPHGQVLGKLKCPSCGAIHGYMSEHLVFLDPVPPNSM